MISARDRLRSRAGQSLPEYAVLLALTAIGLVILLLGIGNNVESIYAGANDALAWVASVAGGGDGGGAAGGASAAVGGAGSGSPAGGGSSPGADGEGASSSGGGSVGGGGAGGSEDTPEIRSPP